MITTDLVNEQIFNLQAGRFSFSVKLARNIIEVNVKWKILSIIHTE